VARGGGARAVTKLVAVTRALNEEDIIEPLIRHHAALVDHHIVLDNGSTDRTLEILSGLIAENIPLTILHNDSSIFSETQFNTLLYRRAVEDHNADWVVFLDADEFVDARGVADLRPFLATIPAEQRTVGLQMVDYEAPSPATENDANVVRRFSRHRRAATSVWKVIVRGNIGADRVTVDAGNHFIYVDGSPWVSMKQLVVPLAHYPFRSPYQWVAKVVTGRLKVLGAGQREVGRQRGAHYNDAYEHLKWNPSAYIAGLRERFDLMKTSADFVDDPIDYLGEDLIYTHPVDYGWRALGQMLATMEKVATMFGEALDADSALRARVDAGLDDLRLVCRHDGEDAPPVAYGSLVTEAWRDAIGPGFAALLGDGWSKPESWGGIWGVGVVHELRLYYHAAPAGHADIEAVVQAALAGPRERQNVDVVVRGETLATWEFTRDKNRGLRSVRVPASVIAASLPVMTLEFRPHSVAAPIDLDPAIRDGRLLGMAMLRVRQRVA